MPTEVEQVRAELQAHPELYDGLRVDRIVDAMNDPKPAGVKTSYRAVTAEEIGNATPIGLVKVQKAAGDYEAAANDAEQAKALAGATLAARLSMVGSIDVAPGTPGRATLDAAVPDFLTAAERDAIVALGTMQKPILQNCWQRWGWDHSVTIALVEEAML